MTQADPAISIAALLDELAENDRERDVMGGALRLLAYAAPDVEPAPGLRARVLARIADDGRGAAFTAGVSYFARAQEMEWTPYAPGISIKLLFQDTATGARTVLVRMEPGLDFPPHPHNAIEDLYLVEGEAWVGDIFMRAGDYCRAPAGTEHNDVRSGASGSLAVVITR
jgi:quercetin dioxygenase-like cupin family protein